MFLENFNMVFTEPLLEAVKQFAVKAHGTQTRRYSDDPYIVHPIRVMEMCRLHTTDVCVLSAALLHDVLEDTHVTKEDLFDFLNGIMDKPLAARTFRIVEELTDVYTRKSYPGINRRSRKSKEADRLESASADAQTIKYADIIDNTDVAFNDPDFALVYLRESGELLERMATGSVALRKQATHRVKECLDMLAQKRSTLRA